MTDLRPIDYNGFVPTDPEPATGPKHRQPATGGWRNVPNWLRWAIAIDLAVLIGATAVALIHP